MAGKIELNRGARTCLGESGIGYVVIPDNDTRDEYINNCYYSCTVTIDGGYGYSYIENVPIPLELLQQIKFPLKEDEVGSRVFWVRENTFNRPVIVGILNNLYEPNGMVAGQNRYVQEINGNVVEIFMDANTAEMNIKVTGSKNNPSKINVISNTNEDSEINVTSSGKVKISAKNLIVEAFKDAVFTLKKNDSKELLKIESNDTQLKITDQFNNEVTLKDGEIDVVSDKINHNGGNEPMVLGNTLKESLSNLIDAILSMTMVTPTGASSTPMNAAQFIQIKSQLNNILSQKSNLE